MIKKSTICGIVNNAYSEFMSKHGHEPSYALCEIRYKDDLTTSEEIISFKGYNEIDDNNVFFYCYDIEEFIELMSEDNSEDFIIIYLNYFY